MIKLFIVGFPRDMVEISLVELFSIHGVVNSITIVRDKQTGISKGYAFITMTDKDGAHRALAALDGIKLADRQLHVRIADDNPDPMNRQERRDQPSFQKVDKIPSPQRLKRPRR